MNLRRIERFKNCPILFIPENNLDDAPAVLYSKIKNMSNVKMYMDENLKQGARTNMHTKARYTKSAELYIHERGERVTRT
jgi:hypothetical protein